MICVTVRDQNAVPMHLKLWMSMVLFGNVHVHSHARGQLINPLISGRMMLYSVVVP